MADFANEELKLLAKPLDVAVYLYPLATTVAAELDCRKMFGTLSPAL